jgi:putative phosphonate metabolism protein
MTGGSGRYAIYFAPEPESALARFGAAWLGCDVAAGTAAAQPAAPGVDADRLRALTAEPRYYGFHATLKPPFALAPGADVEGLVDAIAALAARVAPFAAPPLRLARIAGFLALTLSGPCPATQVLADLCVSEFDRFRAPPAEAELQRRRRAGLSPHQETLLQRWGYPYVMEEFRFHMTLTARLDAAESAIVERALAPMVAPLCAAPLAVDAISLFHQPDRDAPFRLLQRYRLAG